ncbi:dienelactone hydrolase family protein [Pseudorhodoferax sp.]|jgi:carboxymethylenebutenolidase|uniref:dienelactone hydrolase family protein n=1 Tax=Pseudorhodoferax sp. TaxID=1993553 RepID=UPI002DD674C2|nr:dienelactone hydrolase family protein [Pseudorhodoferax sp.]
MPSTLELPRRQLLAGGIALAALPAEASQITTPAQGLTAGEVSVPVGDFQMPAYRAQPAQAKGRLPVVLLVSEIFGVHAHIADVARRFAHAGYLCIAPELFVRQGDAARQPDVQTLVREVISKVPDAQVMADLDACLAWAGANGGDTRRVAVTGFCYGGRITWLYSAHNPAVKAGVAWYGRLVGNASANTPKHPVDRVDQLHGPVLGLYGGQDGGIPNDTVARMQNALQSAQNPKARVSEFVLYRDSPHAFHADYRPSYREADAKDGWARCLAWFRRHGV